MTQDSLVVFFERELAMGTIHCSPREGDCMDDLIFQFTQCDLDSSAGVVNFRITGQLL